MFKANKSQHLYTKNLLKALDRIKRQNGNLSSNGSCCNMKELKQALLYITQILIIHFNILNKQIGKDFLPKNIHQSIQ